MGCPNLSPQRAHPEKGGVLESPGNCLSEGRPVVAAVRHANQNPPLTRSQRRDLVHNPCALEYDESVGRCLQLGLGIADHGLKPCMRMPVRRVALIHHWQQHREMTAAIEIMIVMPADVFA